MRQSIILCLALIVLLLPGALLAQPRDCDYTPTLFSDDSLRGQAFALDRSINDLHSNGFGDSASSVCVPRGWRVILYQDTGFRGDRLELVGPTIIYDLKRDRPQGGDWGDRISSAEVIRMRQYGGADCRDYPILYGNDGFDGSRYEVRDSVSNLHSVGMGDSASSICVPEGWRITVYEDSNFRGSSLTLDGYASINDLKRDRPQGADWGDRISSVRVERSGRNPGRNPGRRPGWDRRPNPTPYPGTNDVRCQYPTFFQDDNFQGRQLIVDNSINDLHARGFGDSFSSACIPAGWTVTVYRDSGYRGSQMVLNGSQLVANLSNDSPDRQNWGDQISSIRVEPRGSYRPSPGIQLPGNPGGNARCQVPVLYSDDSFSGRTLEVTASIPDLGRQGFGDQASSICVPRGWQLVLYSESNYRGLSLTVSSGQEIQDLRRDRPGGQDWGDIASSVQVTRTRR